MPIKVKYSDMNYQTTIQVDGETIKTLADILPSEGKLKILFIAKAPAPISVEKGHYFQGRHGKSLWNKLIDYGILTVKAGTFEDENLKSHGFGITDIVKEPKPFGHEPTDQEYRVGLDRIKQIIDGHNPKMIFFVYKRVLDNILKIGFGIETKAKYGMNTDLENFFKAKIFVYPMPGLRYCTKTDIENAMKELKEEVKSICK